MNDNRQINLSADAVATAEEAPSSAVQSREVVTARNASPQPAFRGLGNSSSPLAGPSQEMSLCMLIARGERSNQGRRAPIQSRARAARAVNDPGRRLPLLSAVLNEALAEEF